MKKLKNNLFMSLCLSFYLSFYLSGYVRLSVYLYKWSTHIDWFQCPSSLAPNNPSIVQNDPVEYKGVISML